MFASVFLVLAFIVAASAFAPSRRFASKTAIRAIPKFNWPGSSIPPSNLEGLFGGEETFSPPGQGGGKKAPTKAAVKGGKNVVAAKGVAPTKMKGGKNMTWGGRPDATPELFIPEPEVQTFMNADWRFNKK
mmetsp:Transcript_7544/g.7614  ORF Transcript_7544/g.7614 Transcript_7544/m.7614 type:complete len:131 (-) Transcript_7544:45-437(-)|eukprot:CAMPEP_0119041452 /NCGR_PEP_ID=MMETSP1177-20130426/12132_1 /TAXON_ID=2985 /ORGANISM="Ochromonas sp, Strain CCMP1899" /LENGTH=130 /DNA_ID=CAMNT_0007007497 /DNA_START=24 /DNA_END=416 /DNA_ORIENTATION=+